MFRFKTIKREIDDGIFYERYPVPIEINGERLWAVIDTGAPKNLIPLEAARKIGLDFDRNETTKYPLLSGIEVEYFDVEMDITVMEYSEPVWSRFNLTEYEYLTNKTAFVLDSMDFRVPNITWSELHDSVEVNHENLSMSDSRSAPLIILGVSFLNKVRFEIFECVELEPQDDRSEFGLELV